MIVITFFLEYNQFLTTEIIGMGRLTVFINTTILYSFTHKLDFVRGLDYSNIVNLFD